MSCKVCNSNKQCAFRIERVANHTPMVGCLSNALIVDTATGKEFLYDCTGRYTRIGKQGFTGPIGPTGPTGDPGGATGATGPIGATGAGATGSMGYTGATGAIGWTGSKGATGAVGLRGPQGYAGPQGLRGATGPTGPLGNTGPQGVTGAQGVQGQQGAPGPQGEPGDKGDTGEGVPTGGNTGQVLAKSSSTDFDTEWVDQSGGGGAVDSVNGQTGVVVLDKSDVGLGSVDNTSDLAKPISTATQTALNDKEDVSNKRTNLTSPNDTTYPTTKAVNDVIGNVMSSALVTFEQLTRKKTDLSTPNNTDYPTTQAVKDYVDANSGADMSQVSATVIHGTNAGMARPSGYANVRWIGSVEPTNMINNDEWLRTE